MPSIHRRTSLGSLFGVSRHSNTEEEEHNDIACASTITISRDDNNEPATITITHDDDNEQEPCTTQQQQQTLSNLDKIIHILEEKEWIYAVLRDKALIYTTCNGSNGSFRVICDLKEDDDMLIVYVYAPIRVPQAKRLDIAEYITRANYGVMIGNFEMDFTDGELRYKGALEYKGGVLVGTMIDQLIGKCAYTMNRYFPGMMRIVYGDIAAQDAIAEIEPDQARGEATEALAEALVQALTDAAAAAEAATVVSADDSTGSSAPIVVATPSSDE